MNWRRSLARRATLIAVALACAVGSARAQSTMPAPDYFGAANWANSPPIHKFVNTLPGLCGISPWGTGGANELGQCIPVATPDTSSYPGSDYYQIGLTEYARQLHADLPATRLRGYVQLDASGNAPPGANQYLGPLILATRDRPVRIRFRNLLPTGSAGDLFIPTDTTYMGAGDGPLCADGTPATPTSTCVRARYTQNRATLHLHGGNTPWISDGTPHQWTAPAGESTFYKKGVSARDVPDMPATGDGEQTYYWTNQQSGRLMFYHDHAYGLTRLNVYSGEAAGYLLVDPAQESALAAATVPGTITGAPDYAHLVPLVIQDKTFVPDATTLAATDPTWDATKYGALGSLWFPHVYVPNQNPYDASGANPVGRWDYGPWFWPPQNPATLLSPPVSCTSTAYPGQSITCPGTPNPSGTPEAFMDTMLVNGTAYPSVQLEPAAYRFQILSAGNDRTLNLGLYYAATAAGVVCKGGAVADLGTCTEVSMVPAVPPTSTSALPACATPTATSGAGLALADTTGGAPVNGTGLPAGCWPSTWPTDGRDGGVPDPTTAGPAIVQLGTEGGLLPAPVVIPSTPVGYEYNRRSITVLNIFFHGLLIGPAERADVVVDLSSVPAGSALILYNDAPAPVPAFDTRFDYYTGDPDQTSTGGAPTTQPGLGPNTRTVMQIQVNGTSTNAMPFSLAALQAAQPAAFVATQDKIIVPETAYPAANGGASADGYVRIQDTSISYWNGGPVPGLTLTSGGSGYSTAPAVTISGGGGTGATATATLAVRPVASLALTTGGSGYTSAPLVTLTGGGGTGATATATLTGTTVASVAVTSGGSGYTSAPAVTLSGGGGSGATAVATLKAKSVSTITITNKGTGYTSAPVVIITGGGGAGAAATAALTPTSVGALTVTNGGSGYSSAPTVAFSRGGGTGAAATATLAPAAVAGVTLTSGGTGYTSAPTVTFTGDGTGAAATANTPTFAILPKTIQELFTLDYGRMNATLGVELPFTNFLTQTTIPYGFVDPPTEIFKDGETQFWKITHNGVDTHFLHFHLFTVQVLNRVGWDGAVKPPDANELSWKDTVRMNPLEDIVVALHPVKQTLPWQLPNSVRPLDVTQPVGTTSTMAFTNVDPSNQPAAVVNDTTNFGYEYVWHCHILGHEENDMMRAMAFVVPPAAPSAAAATVTGTSKSQKVVVTWADNSANETGFTVQRAPAATGPWTSVGSVAPDVTTFTDATVAKRTTYWYRVVANDVVGYTRAYASPASGYPNVAADSAPSPAVSVVTQ
ncbi:hypothetical protein [Anaeromyxobacter oryzae]|uniref:Fibronectin type-III domain-containing protein n=1 Tax=Anaeromyxobacter oryzae TaxID=2918170 RepID=A0ABM7WPL2_9BACT|nr:hypothetical protein [Anaeromyxobacter oryzae]BDG01399.1 hypothetical protein AMOR_03950 [Anaeromyxobacter oryzae]